MTGKELNELYFDWMYELVCVDEYARVPKYRKLLRYLHGVEFVYILPMDGNRAEDGISFRYRFGYECGYEDAMVAAYLDTEPCSVLEMMMALAMRCEEHIMENPEVGNRMGVWFWNMIVSLGLGHMDDSNFDERYAEKVVSRFLDRKYDRNGKGGLFTVENIDKNMRSIDIWYQMCWYLNDFEKEAWI